MLLEAVVHIGTDEGEPVADVARATLLTLIAQNIHEGGRMA